MRCSNTSATDPRELLFQFGRCVVHFAVDDAEVRFCTHLKGKASWFLPFNEGWNVTPPSLKSRTPNSISS
jgi:type I site-specific restriction-modification system R (restriction) subunit